MKIITSFAASAALGLSAFAAQAADDVTLQLKWVTQAQFAGYYVALDKGFYEEEDLSREQLQMIKARTMYQMVEELDGRTAGAAALRSTSRKA